MTLETLIAKDELRTLLNDYGRLGDAKDIAEQMKLFTKDATYKVVMNGNLVADTSGRETIEAEFNGHAALVETYFTLNGQDYFSIGADAATGISFSQIKMIREQDGARNITDYSVRYEDSFVREGGRWKINARVGHFVIIDARNIG